MNNKDVITCEQCNGSLRVPTHLGSIKVHCPHCKAIFIWTPKKCLNCGYMRQEKDNDGIIPLTECPECRKIYKKIEQELEEKKQKEEEMRRKIDERKLEEQNEKYINALKQEGKIASGLGKVEINKLDKATCHYKWGNNAFNEGLFECAIDEFTQAIKFHPLYIDAYTQRSLAYKKLKKHVEALADMKAATRYREIIEEQRERHRKTPENNQKRAETADQINPQSIFKSIEKGLKSSAIGIIRKISLKTAIKKSLFDVTNHIEQITRQDSSFDNRVREYISYMPDSTEIEGRTWEGSFARMVSFRAQSEMPSSALIQSQKDLALLMSLISEWIASKGGNAANVYREFE